MHYSLLDILFLLSISASAGLIGTLLGLGGGLFLIPALTLIFKVDIQTAIATSTLIIISNSVGGSLQKIKNGFISLPLCRVLELNNMIFGLLGAHAALTMDPEHLMSSFSLLILFIAAIMLVPDSKKRYFLPVAFQRKSSWLNRHLPYITGNGQSDNLKNAETVLAICGLSGFLGGMFGIGGGVLMVPVFSMVGGMPFKSAAATSTYLMGITAATSGLYFLMAGKVQPELTAWNLLGATVGIWVGNKIFNLISNDKLKIIFVVVLVATGVKIWLR